MGRLPKAKTLSEKVLNGETVDYSDYSQKELIECITLLATKVKEKEKVLLSDSQLKAIKNSLENQVKKIANVLENPIKPLKQNEADKLKDDEQPNKEE